MKKNKNSVNSFELIVIHFRRELKTIFSDKGAMLVLIGAMLIYPIVYSFSYKNEALTDLSIGIVNLDQSSLSNKYTKMLDATKGVAINMEPLNLNEAEDLLLSNKISGVVLIPKGFERDVLNGKQANVAVYADGSYFLKYKTLYTAATTVNTYFSKAISIKSYMLEGKSFKQAKTASSPLDIQSKVLYNPTSAYGSFIMPGMILIIIQQTLLIGIGIIGGSFSKSKISPFVLPQNKRIKEIFPFLFGKSGAYLFISIINMVIVVFWFYDWFNYPDKASVINVVMLLFPFLISTIFLGILISAFFKHRESAIVFMVFLSPIAFFFSGVSWPVSAMPNWLVGISKILPATNVVPAYSRLRIMGVGIENIKSDLLFLYGQAAVYILITFVYYFIRTKVEKKKII